MSPSSGDALLCFVKERYQPEASVQTGTAKAVAVVVTGADLRLAVISDSHGRLIAPPNSSFSAIAAMSFAHQPAHSPQR